MTIPKSYVNKWNKPRAEGGLPDWQKKCLICGKELDPRDDDTELSKTKRGRINFFHGSCARKERSCGR